MRLRFAMAIPRYFKPICFVFVLALTTQARGLHADEVSGIIIPRDNDGMYVRNENGQFEVTWTPATKVALVANTRLFAGFKGDRLDYRIHSSKEVVTFPILKGPITGIRISRGGKQLDQALNEARDERWISERGPGLRLYFNQTPQKEQLPTTDDPRFIGVWDPTTKPRTLSINGTKYELSLKKGGQTTALLFNVLTVKNCKPFINRATVIGQKKDGKLIADEIHVLPIGDQASHDDPKKRRYLFIGDSISGNYDKGLRETLGGHFNLHHPPTNCGPSAKGVENIVDWLGAYDQPGRHWDVISFNHGHWDANNDKASYQANLEKIIIQLQRTNAKLVWVTTCPVPDGFETAGDPGVNGKAPGRVAGVMKNYLNPWALEIIRRYPEISICDQWQFVKDHQDGLYKNWWTGKNVHFGGETADALGKFLGEHVAKVMNVELKTTQRR